MSSACSRGIAFILEQNGASRTGISFLQSKKGVRRARSLTVSLDVVAGRCGQHRSWWYRTPAQKVTGASPVVGYSPTQEENVIILLVSSSQLKKVQINSANKG